MKFEGFEKKIK